MDVSGDISGGNGWVLAVNLVIWTGLFLYLLRLDRRLLRAEMDSEKEQS